MPSQDVFRYFGYGSNLLKERILIHNPSAKFISIGRLNNFRFCFESIVNRGAKRTWFGAAANIKEASSDDYVMGAVWEILKDEVCNLDRQERAYRALEVPVDLQDGSTITCRTYQIKVEVTDDCLPDPYYKKVVVVGAKQIGLPADYIKFLESFPDTKDMTVPPAYIKVLEVVKQLTGRDDLEEF